MDTTPAPKTCTKCGHAKAATTVYFMARPRSRSGLSAECRTCNNARSVQWQKNNRATVNAWKRAQWAAGTGGQRESKARQYAANKAKIIAHTVQQRREKRHVERDALGARRCGQCLARLAKRQGETWARFTMRTLCGSVACLKRHMEAEAWGKGQAARQKALAQAEERDRQARARELARYSAQLQAQADAWAASGTPTVGLGDKRGKAMQKGIGLNG